MFLAKPSNWNGDPPVYLVAGDRAIWLQDKQSQTAFTRIGVPIVTFTKTMFTSLTTIFDPYVDYPVARRPLDEMRPQFVPAADPLIDGGDASTVYADYTYDGGTSATFEFDDLPADSE